MINNNEQSNVFDAHQIDHHSVMCTLAGTVRIANASVIDAHLEPKTCTHLISRFLNVDRDYGVSPPLAGASGEED
ncbi:hypothetical protein VTP01DRAFT_5907 [Rhizomucor pusillus]|uniref:uncharacterized protein n=1 Tax=Rhizomucor pusillus TaxID=4840 RepID=UPI0037426317